MKVFKSDAKRDAIWRDYERLVGMWGAACEQRDIINEFGTTHVLLTGDEKLKPLVLFHGVGDNSAVMWLRNIRALSERFRCVAVDTIGGPGKSVPGAAYDKNFSQKAWIDQLLDALNIERCHMAGVSNGAAIAFGYASQSERVERVACIEGGFILDRKVAWSTFLKAIPASIWPSERNVRKLMTAFAHPRPGFFEENPDILEHMVLIMRGHNQMAMAYNRPYVYDPALSRRLKGRALFLLGEYSGAKHGPFTDCLAREGFGYTLVRDAGHGANMEQPEAVNSALISFFANDGQA